MNANRTTRSAAIVAGITAAMVGAVGYAGADPPDDTNAADVVTHLEEEGYAVEFNTDSETPLEQCTVSEISGIDQTDAIPTMVPAPADTRGTAYITLDCPKSSEH